MKLDWTQGPTGALAAIAGTGRRPWPDMHSKIPLLLLVAACAAPPEPPQVDGRLGAPWIAEMRRLASVDCPVPPDMYEMDMVWWVGLHAAVVAVDQGMLALRVEEPAKWPDDRQYLLLPVAGRGSQDGIKVDAVVVGQSGDLLICRFFQRPEDIQEPPAVGDHAWVDHATSRAMRSAWRARRR